ncbi:MAG: hypothetical protein NTZ60_02340 [Campylobacterales bacterium]|nr:hypothetical protein [Campylobacterales bacterium]
MSFVLLNNERLRNELENGNSKLLDSLIFEIDGINYETTKQKIKELAQQKQSSYDFAKAIIMEFYK